MQTTTQLPNWLLRCAENTPGQLAVSCNNINWTFADLHAQAEHLARQLATLGVKEGTRVALLARNGLPFVTCVHALTRLGAILVPLNIRLTHEEHCWQLSDVEATHLLSDLHFTSQASAIHAQLPSLNWGTIIQTTLDQQATTTPHTNHHYVLLEGVAETAVPLRTLLNLDNIQTIMYTSGTTGKPKGVIITYGMQWWNAIGSALNLGHRPDDCWLACLPLFHIGGLSILFRSVIYGIRVVIEEKFAATQVNTAIRERGVTIISVVSIMLQRMLTALHEEQQQYPATLRCILLGGGPAPRSLLEECARLHIPVVQTYGLTESCSQAVTLSPSDALRKLGSAGRPLLPVQLKIVNGTHDAPAEEAGMICLKGPSITTGYDHRPEETARVITDGWLSTGDIGYLDHEGYLYVLDRRSDLIISGGENVYPAEIEGILLAHPAIEEAGVCAQEDPQWGQVPIAFVTLKANQHVSPTDLQTYAAQHLARYKQPRQISIVAALPRNSSGKLLRRELPKLLPPS